MTAMGGDDHLARLYSPTIEEPWFRSLFRNIREAIHPPQLPPLQVTSKPVAVRDIWGLYGKDKKSNLFSLAIHGTVVVLLFTVASSKAVQQMAKSVIPLVAPDIAPYVPKMAEQKQQMQGGGGGIGSGSGGGVGSGKGGGFGPGEGGGVGGGVFRVGGGVSAPVVLYKVDPEYSEEARKAKYSGTVVLQLVVDPAGKARDIRVVRSLGLGLDEKAIEAVNKWRFKPGYRNGQAVAVQATIEVNFRLL